MENRLERALAVESEIPPGTELAAAVRTLATDLPHLVREELALAKLEARAAAVRAGTAAATAWLGMLGLVFLMAGTAILVSQATESLWAGPVIVGIALVASSGVALAFALGRLGNAHSDEKAHASAEAALRT